MRIDGKLGMTKLTIDFCNIGNAPKTIFFSASIPDTRNSLWLKLLHYSNTFPSHPVVSIITEVYKKFHVV
jgi:hypothetical protein